MDSSSHAAMGTVCLLDCCVCSLPPLLPFSFPRVVLKATADTFLHENTQLISCCACILTSSKSQTQFSVICCSIQFHFKRVPCTVSLLATKLHSFTAFLVLPQYSSASHSSRLPAFSSFFIPIICDQLCCLFSPISISYTKLETSFVTFSLQKKIV